jgi:hypothetical protein
LTETSTNIEDNKGGISNIIKNLEATSANFEAFSDNVKRHPWKLLFKGKEKPSGQKKSR